jgi:NlpE N-terminal domain
MLKKWMGLCSLAVVFMLVAGACSKKEEAAESEAVEEVDTTPAETAAAPAVGIYMAQMPAADTPGRTIMLTLNADNTATMSVDLMNGQPATVETGTWATNAMSGVDVTLQRDVSGTMVSSTMSFAMMGDTLSLNSPVDAGFGDMGLKLVKSPAGESHEGHSH